LHILDTLLARSDAVATIYFIMQFCAASVQEWLLFESSIYFNSVVSVQSCKGFEKRQFYTHCHACHACHCNGYWAQGIRPLNLQMLKMSWRRMNLF